jgi:acetyl esterase/lipase
MKKPAYYEEIPIWGNEIPLTLPEDAAKVETAPESGGVIRIHDTTVPTIKYYPATGDGPHPAILVCPGGGYQYQAVNLEGYDIAAWLNTIGFSAFILKYRCPQRRDAAHADAARAMRFIRANAEALQIRPDALGCIGFSAGAHLCATISAPSNPIPYEPTDELDQIEYRSDFTLLIYPAYLADKETLQLQPEFSVGADAPSTFIVQTQDDGINVENAVSWYLAMRKADRPCEMHLYAQGGHGYGVTKQGKPVNEWTKLAEVWLRREGNIK